MQKLLRKLNKVWRGDGSLRAFLHKEQPVDDDIDRLNSNSKQLLKHVRMLDKQFNEAIADFARSKKELDECLRLLKEELDSLADQQRKDEDHQKNMAKSLHRLESMSANFMSKEELRKEVKDLLGPFESMLRSFDAEMHVVMERCRVASDNAAEHEARLRVLENDDMQCMEKVSAMHDELRLQEEDLDGIQRQLKEMHADQLDNEKSAKKVMDSYKQEVEKALADVNNLELEMSAKLLKHLNKSSESIERQFADLKDEALKAFQNNDKERREMKEAMDHLKYEMLKAVQGGRAPSEMEDFLKQVRFNAEQIARLNERLDSSK